MITTDRRGLLGPGRRDGSKTHGDERGGGSIRNNNWNPAGDPAVGPNGLTRVASQPLISKVWTYENREGAQGTADRHKARVRASEWLVRDEMGMPGNRARQNKSTRNTLCRSCLREPRKKQKRQNKTSIMRALARSGSEDGKRARDGIGFPTLMPVRLCNNASELRPLFSPPRCMRDWSCGASTARPGLPLSSQWDGELQFPAPKE